jgi:hypothetical protein
MPNPLHILYTSNLNGDLDLLPRLYTFLRYLKSLPIDESDVMLCAVQPQTPRVLFLDLGHACAPDVWHCTATDGRSTLIALDAMGYQAANISGALTPESRIRLRDNLLGMALIDADHDAQHEDLLFTTRREGSQILPHSIPPLYAVEKGLGGEEHHNEAIRLSINLTPASTTHLTATNLHLADVHAGQIGMAQISFLTGSPTLNAKSIFDVPPDTAPDPTIAATVDFIRSEARFYIRSHSQN